MAEHILETRILLRYGTYLQWMNSNLILKVGEPAIATFPSGYVVEDLSNARPDNTPPAIGIKIGDGRHYFSELPWVQAVAADVYNWAKQVSKPVYTASEISGLDTYLEEHGVGGGGSGGGTTVARRYQLFQGTGINANKYYLRYRDNDDGEWIVDWNYSIDLSRVVELLEWIGNDIDNFSSLGSRTEDHINYKLSALSVDDEEQEHKVITSVSETNGLISTTRRQLIFDDIGGIVPVSKGGTGKTEFESGEVLVGNGENEITSIEISTSVDNTRTLIYNYAVKAYVDAAVAGLTGAMHYIGEATVPIGGAVNPQIPDYNFSKALAGDVVTFEKKEYVWTGSAWRLLGDEGSYAVKGSIMDADISADAEIQMSKIADLIATLQSKVDKEDGKQLSSNDYTDEDRGKLAGIQEGAQQNAIETIFLNDKQYLPTTVNGISKAINLEVQEFTDEDRTLLERINTMEDGAQVNKIEHIKVDGTEITVDSNKTVSIVTDPHTDHINKIEEIYINNQRYYPDQNKAVHITLDETALDLQVISGAQVPSDEGYDEVDVLNKKLQLARVADTGNIDDLLQTSGTYIIFYGGSSTEVI